MPHLPLLLEQACPSSEGSFTIGSTISPPSLISFVPENISMDLSGIMCHIAWMISSSSVARNATADLYPVGTRGDVHGIGTFMLYHSRTSCPLYIIPRCLASLDHHCAFSTLWMEILSLPKRYSRWFRVTITLLNLRPGRPHRILTATLLRSQTRDLLMRAFSLSHTLFSDQYHNIDDITLYISWIKYVWGIGSET
jgi:hypothetical protein